MLNDSQQQVTINIINYPRAFFAAHSEAFLKASDPN